MPRILVLTVVAAALLAAGGRAALAADLYVVVEDATSPGDATPLRVRLGGGGALEIEAWRVAGAAALIEAGVRLDHGETLGWLDPRAARRSAAEQDLFRAAGLVPALTPRPGTVPAAGEAEVDLPLSRPGLYLVAVTAGSRRAYATALVTDLGLVVKRDGAGALVWAVDRRGGRPWAGASVTLRAPGAAQRTATTGDDGLAVFAGPLSPTLQVEAMADDHLAFGTSASWAGTTAHHRVYLHTHQPAYRPGERVEVRGILRSVQDGRLRLDPAIGTARVFLRAPDGTERGEVDAPVSAHMGTFAAGIDLAADAPTGDWAVVAELGGRGYEAPLVVDAYRKPAFEVSVQARAARVPVGTQTAFEVSAAFYDGGRLAGAPVTWRLLHQRFDRELFPEDELVKLFFGTEREAYRPTTLAEGRGVLDARGRLEVPVQVPADLASGALALQATVTGPDRAAVVASGRLAVSTTPLVVDLRTDRHLYGVEDVARVVVRAELADGRPAAGRAGVLTVARAPEPTPGMAPEETWLHTLPFETGADGRAVVEAPLADAGRYALEATMQPGAGETALASARLHVWAVGERATPGPAAAALDAIADRDAYEVGDTARLLVLPAGGARPVLATVEGEGLLQRALLLPDEAPPLFSLPLEEAHVPNVFVTFSSVVAGRLLTTTRMVRIPPRTRLLDVRVLPDAAEIEPGAESGLTVEVRDAQGRGVADAEVDVAVVDEALYALHADPTAPVEAFFHPPRRNAVSTEDLLGWTSVGFSVAGAGGKLEAPSESAAPGDAVPPGTRAPESPAAGAEPMPTEDAGADAEEPEVVEAEEDGYAGRGGLRAAAKDRGAGEPEAASVREDFRSAVFWAPALPTDAQGRVRLDAVSYGDALTRWRVTAHGLDADTRVGTGTAAVRTRREVAASITLPRFLLAGDRAQVPLVLRNLTETDRAASWRLSAEAAVDGWSEAGTLTLGANGTEVLEREFHPQRPGTVSFEAALLAGTASDAERRELAVLPQGIPKVVGTTLFARDGATTAELAVPRHAERGSVSCRVSIEPAYLQAMTSALPYLLEYPYGCTEQTLDRFVPLLAASEALDALGRPAAPAAGDLDAMIEAGLRRLAVLQHPDGGFGWWEHDATDAGMTALVVRGLARLLAVRPEREDALIMHDRAAAALAHVMETSLPTLDPATKASLLLALAGTEHLPGFLRGLPRHDAPLVTALTLRACVAVGDGEGVAALRGLLDDDAHREGDVLWWGREEGRPVERWQDDAVETTATVLLALLQAGVRPEVLDGGARWLLEARVGGDRWQSTRDTAAAVEFLAAYTRATGDLGAGRAVSLDLDGQTIYEAALDREAALAGPVLVDVPVETLAPGATFRLTLRCAQGGAGAGVALRCHETGPAISASDAGFAVTRRFFRLAPVEREGRLVYERTPVTETVPAGTLVECEVTVETDRPREYVMVTSPHAGGFEPAREVGMTVEGRAPAAASRVDARDDRTMFFVARLPAGRHVFRHTLRATHVGAFTALPAMAELMYFPDVRGNSDGELWQVTPAGPVGEER